MKIRNVQGAGPVSGGVSDDTSRSGHVQLLKAFRQKYELKVESSHIDPVPGPHMASPISTSPTRVVHLLQSMDLSVYYHPPKSTVYVRVHAWRCTCYGV